MDYDISQKIIRKNEMSSRVRAGLAAEFVGKTVYWHAGSSSSDEGERLVVEAHGVVEDVQQYRTDICDATVGSLALYRKGFLHGDVAPHNFHGQRQICMELRTRRASARTTTRERVWRIDLGQACTIDVTDPMLGDWEVKICRSLFGIYQIA